MMTENRKIFLYYYTTELVEGEGKIYATLQVRLCDLVAPIVFYFTYKFDKASNVNRNSKHFRYSGKLSKKLFNILVVGIFRLYSIILEKLK